MKRVPVAVAAVVAFAFAGCSASPEETNSITSPDIPETTVVAHDSGQLDQSSSTAPTSSPATEVATDGPYAAKSLEYLLTRLNIVYQDNKDLEEHFTGECNAPFETLEEFRECSPHDPIAYLDSIESPRQGELIVTLMPEAWGGGEYDPDRVFTVPYLAEILHGYIGMQTQDMLQVTTTTPDGQYHATHGRLPAADTLEEPKNEAELEAWAKDRFADWLRSMNFTYQGLCGGVDSVADYRQCVPDDPHGYITSVEAPAAGELVVRIENGAWQGGPYVPAAEFMAGNMMLKIGSYSNDVDYLTVITEDGDSHTVQYHPGGGYAETTREPSL